MNPQQTRENPTEVELIAKRRGYARNLSAYNYWLENKHLSLVAVCDKYDMTESCLRCWMLTYNRERPDDRKEKRIARAEWIRKGYNKGLEEDLTARESSNWASEQSGFHIQRGDVQSYGAKFDLPQLRETDNGINIGKHSKYA